MPVTMISSAVEISIAGGVEETKDGSNYCDFFSLFFFFFLFLIIQPLVISVRDGLVSNLAKKIRDDHV